MTYIVYTPDVERGPEAYTQRQFESLRALARWAMDAALDEPVAAAAAPVIVAESEPVPDVDPTISLIAVQQAMCSTPLKDLPVTPPDCKPIALDWLRYMECLWYRLTPIEFVYNTVRMDGLLGKEIRLVDVAEVRNKLMTPEDQKWLFLLSCRNPAYISTQMTPYVHNPTWNDPPQGFYDACKSLIESEHYECWATGDAYPLHSTAIDAMRMLKTLREGLRHKSWGNIKPSSENPSLQWGAAAAPETAQYLLTEWWSGRKPSDEIREFVLQMIVVRFYKSTMDTVTVGSREFLDSYQQRARFIDVDGSYLPKGFLEWATAGTTYSNCKAALGGLGIASVRRAEGQKYTGLREIELTYCLGERQLEWGEWTGMIEASWVCEDTLEGYTQTGMMAPFNMWDTTFLSKKDGHLNEGPILPA